MLIPTHKKGKWLSFAVWRVAVTESMRNYFFVSGREPRRQSFRQVSQYIQSLIALIHFCLRSPPPEGWLRSLIPPNVLWTPLVQEQIIKTTDGGAWFKSSRTAELKGDTKQKIKPTHRLNIWVFVNWFYSARQTALHCFRHWESCLSGGISETKAPTRLIEAVSNWNTKATPWLDNKRGDHAGRTIHRWQLEQIQSTATTTTFVFICWSVASGDETRD